MNKSKSHIKITTTIYSFTMGGLCDQHIKDFIAGLKSCWEVDLNEFRLLGHRLHIDIKFEKKHDGDRQWRKIEVSHDPNDELRQMVIDSLTDEDEFFENFVTANMLDKQAQIHPSTIAAFDMTAYMFGPQLEGQTGHYEARREQQIYDLFASIDSAEKRQNHASELNETESQDHDKSEVKTDFEKDDSQDQEKIDLGNDESEP